jgi:tRNA (adenine-N(1)-)-methyltransferase non-catalytic subunit
MHARDARRICNLRSDTLGYMLSSANISAGQRVLVMDTAVQGIVTAAVTRRMGGYGSVYALYEGQQAPGYLEVVQRMNFNVMERQALKWVGLGEVFASEEDKLAQMEGLKDQNGVVVDVEKRDREVIEWPCPLMDHTRNYLMNEITDEKKRKEFLDKRSARFTRKLTRLSMLEIRERIDSCKERDEGAVAVNGDSVAKDTGVSESAMMETDNDNTTTIPQSLSPGPDGIEISQCDSIIIATKYDPTATILRLLPYLAPSCPFVIFHEFLEPLLETFRTLQNGGVGDNELNDMPMMCRRNIAINLRLTDTWFREYQVLEGRTHPNMHMSQNGGYILMGTKLCPKTGTNEMDADTVKMLRAKLGPTRRPKKGGEKRKNADGEPGNEAKKAKS